MCVVVVLDLMLCATSAETPTLFDWSAASLTLADPADLHLTATVQVVGSIVEVPFRGHTSTNVAAIFVMARTTCVWVRVLGPGMDAKAITKIIGLP